MSSDFKNGGRKIDNGRWSHDNNALTASNYVRTYTSFSGCDIICAFGNSVIGELQAITYSIQRVEFGK